MAFKDNLRYMREREGYSQEELAKKLGVSQNTVAGLELGTRNANHVIIINLGKIFDCSADELLKETE